MSFCWKWTFSLLKVPRLCLYWGFCLLLIFPLCLVFCFTVILFQRSANTPQSLNRTIMLPLVFSYLLLLGLILPIAAKYMLSLFFPKQFSALWSFLMHFVLLNWCNGYVLLLCSNHFFLFPLSPPLPLSMNIFLKTISELSLSSPLLFLPRLCNDQPVRLLLSFCAHLCISGQLTTDLLMVFYSGSICCVSLISLTERFWWGYWCLACVLNNPLYDNSIVSVNTVYRHIVLQFHAAFMFK